MHADRHALLSTDYERHAAIIAAAKEFGLTADEVVRAGIGAAAQGAKPLPPSEPGWLANRAAREVLKALPGAFAGLEPKDWEAAPPELGPTYEADAKAFEADRVAAKVAERAAAEERARAERAAAEAKAKAAEASRKTTVVSARYVPDDDR